MSSFALALVLGAAGVHATWNVLAKRSGGGVPFIWLTFAITTALYLPVVAIAIRFGAAARFDAADWFFVIGNGVLHLAYFVVLQRGYRAGDFSVVYPLARGTGPLLSSIFAIVLFGEHPSLVALGGIAFVVCGVFVLTVRRSTFGDANARVSVAYGIATGTLIAAYTLWDKHAVAAPALGGLGLSPILYDFGGNVVRLAALSPFVVRRRQDVAREWRDHRAEAFGVAILSPLAYLLVLWALVFTPVSLVAPLREVSILIGAFLGARIFGERNARARFVAAGLMFAGIVALARG
jgi:drug/metabolite transporter (DMT)-like permease